MTGTMRQLARVIRVAGLRRTLSFERARRGWNGMLKGYFLARVVQTALALGLLDEMRKRPVDPAAFAAARGLRPRVVAALCEYLYVRGVLDRAAGGYALSEEGEFLVDNELMRGWVMLAHGYEGVVHNLEQLARGDAEYGRDVVRDGGLVAEGSGLAGAGVHIPLIAGVIEQHGYRTVLDVGCGDGAFLRRLCRALPHVRAVGIDLSADAIALGRHAVAAEGLGDRITLHVGNALDLASMPHVTNGVDAVTSFFVLHELCDGAGNDNLQHFLVSIGRALPDAALLAVETIRPSAEALRRRPGPAVEYYLLHDLSGQFPLGLHAWRRALDRAGFSIQQELDLSFTRSAVFVAMPRPAPAMAAMPVLAVGGGAR